jgi:hypothetical protein
VLEYVLDINNNPTASFTFVGKVYTWKLILLVFMLPVKFRNELWASWSIRMCHLSFNRQVDVPATFDQKCLDFRCTLRGNHVFLTISYGFLILRILIMVSIARNQFHIAL